MVGAKPAPDTDLEIVARPLGDWHEDIGQVLWWRFPFDEPPYVGTPNDRGQLVAVYISLRSHKELTDRSIEHLVGGWPGYHTHFTPFEVPNRCALPKEATTHAY